jgi:hypothetical protein
MAKTEISGGIVDMFVRGDLGIKAYGYDPSAASGTPLSAVVHIKDAYAKGKYLGNVLLVKEGQNLKFVVGANFSDRLGFGLKASVPAGELVHELFVPAIPDAAAEGWVHLPSPLDRDDEGRTFKVRYALDMDDELQIKDYRERTRLTIYAWPITSWELNGSVYDSSMRYAAVRSAAVPGAGASPAGRLAGLVKGDPLPLTTNLKHARVHAADWEQRQSIDLQLMATDKDIEVKPRAAAAE